MRVYIIAFIAIVSAMVFGGCAKSVEPYDYSAFREHHPKSILVLPPINNSNDIVATPAVFAQVVMPLAESGYYVFSPSLVSETFKNNGLTVPNEIHAVSLHKLDEVFGADAVLYIEIKEYGSSYKILSSDITVSLNAKLVDIKTGKLLWKGTARASSAEGKSNNGNIIGMLIGALIDQIANTVSDNSYKYAGIADNRLLFAGRNGALLYGHRSDKYAKEEY